MGRLGLVRVKQRGKSMGKTLVDWSEERVEILIQLWNQGIAAPEIADQLGPEFSRGMIIGKIDRLRKKYPDKFKLAVPRRSNRGNSRRVRWSSESGWRLTQTVNKIPEADPMPTPTPPPARRKTGVTLLQLNNQTCRWPIGDPKEPDFYFCGDTPHSGYVYCWNHFCLAYQPLNARQGLSSTEGNQPETANAP